MVWFETDQECVSFNKSMYLTLRDFLFSSTGSLSEIIEEHRKKMVTSDELKVRLVVRRKHVFEDALHKIKGLDVNRCLKITFINKPAVDAGGPLSFFICCWCQYHRITFCSMDHLMLVLLPTMLWNCRVEYIITWVFFSRCLSSVEVQLQPLFSCCS